MKESVASRREVEKIEEMAKAIKKTRKKKTLSPKEKGAEGKEKGREGRGQVREGVEVVSLTQEGRSAKKTVARVEPRGPVLITGIAGRLGWLLTKRLHREMPVVGLDRRGLEDRPKDVEVLAAELRRRKAEDLFRRARPKAVCHLGIMHDPRASREEIHSFNIQGLSRLLDFCIKYEVKKLVVLSTANVYGPRPDNPNFLTVDAPLRSTSANSESRSLVELDMFTQSFFWKNPQVETVILRPVHIVGKVRNAFSNYLRMPFPMTMMGFDPMLQLIHEEDVVEAICCALFPGIQGVFNIVGPGELPISHIFKVLQKNHLPVPYSVARPLFQRLFRLGLTALTPDELDFLRFSCMVDGGRARDLLGFQARRGLIETICSVL